MNPETSYECDVFSSPSPVKSTQRQSLVARPAPVVRILILTVMPTFAAIDIGSNSVRLKIARLQAGRLKEVHEDREVTRLGEGVFSGGLLSPDAMSETVRVFRPFHRATQECGTDSVKVVATAG